MYSLRHVFWRGAMALSLLTLGIGSGFGFRQGPVQAGEQQAQCDASRHAARTGNADAISIDGIRIDRVRIDRGRAMALQVRPSRVARRG